LWVILQVCEKQWNHIFSYEHRRLAESHGGSEENLIKVLPMANSMWVTLQIFLKSCSIFSLWLIGCEQYQRFCGRQSHHIFSYDWQGVSDIVHFVKGSLITSSPVTNRKWVTLHILWKAVSSHFVLSPTVCEWHCTFCERQSHHIFSYDQQRVSDMIAHFVKGSLIWPTVCEWHCTFCEMKLHHIFSVCEWHSTFCKRQSHCILSYTQ